MGRRKSSSSSTSGGGNKRNKATTTTTTSSSSASATNDHHHHHHHATTGVAGTVEQLSMLRSFLGMENNNSDDTTGGSVLVCGHLITESDLMDCLRKSGYNVQLAAEQLMTGVYHQQMKKKKKSNSNNNNMSIAVIQKSSSSNISTSTSTSTSSTISTGNNPSKRKDPPPMTAVKKKVNNASSTTFAKAIPPATTTKTAVSSSSLSKNKNNTGTTAGSGSEDSSSGGGWLLCQRWISDAVCTVRSGRIQYQEVLKIEHAYMSSSNHNNNNNKKTTTSSNNNSKKPAAAAAETAPYVTSIRFRGTQHGVNGRLPDTIANLLTPLLRHDNSMIYIHAQALMDMNALVTGSEIPISLTIYITNPRAFFQLFQELDNKESSTKSSTGTQFWEAQKLLSAAAAAGNNHNTLQRGKRRRMPLVQQAAFDLLQWAEYGDVPDFIKAAAAPIDENNKTTTTSASSSGASAAATANVDLDGNNDPDGQDEDEEEENLVELSEADFDKAGEENEQQANDDDDDDNDASTATAPPLPKDWSAGSDNAAALLPEAPQDPVGFKEGIRLCRPYQSQALYWMMQREKGVMMDNTNSSSTGSNDSGTEPDSVMQEQMNLLSELVAASTRQQQQHRPSSLQPQQGHVVCECGPVLLSEKAQAQTKTLAGGQAALYPVVSQQHPLWSRRFLIKSDSFLDASNLPFLSNNKNNNNAAAPDTMCFHVNEVLGVARHEPPEPPTPCRGGILADSMGLGKTVMLLALMLASKQEREQQQAGLVGQAKTTAKQPSTTLIVVKLSMLPQWQDEIQSKTNLTFSTYYGPGSNNATALQEFHNVDIVLTTYGTIQGEAALRRAAAAKKQPLLLQHEWLRVILDEAHCIKNTATLASKACCNLKAQYRWCVSGTIIQNSVEDLFGLLKFLHHEPWCLPPFWKAAITKPMLLTMANTATTTGDAKNNNSNIQDQDKMARERVEAVRMVLGRLRRILAPIMLRRTKDSRTLDGKPILTLPPVETQVVHVELLPAEREFYNAILARSLTLFEGFVDSGTAARSYLQILSMISRLRQTCDHIALTVRTRMEDEDWNAAIFESNDNDSSDKNDDDDDEGKPGSKKVPTPASKSSRSSGASNDAIGKQFFQGLLAKFCTSPSPRKKKERNDDDISTADEESPDKKRPRNKATLYLSNVANALTDAVKANATHVHEECALCLDAPAIHRAVLTPCGHIFCRECLLGFLRENAKPQDGGDGVAAPKKGMAFHCPDGQCPCCSKQIQASRIVALSKSGPNGETLTSNYLTSMKPPSSTSVAAAATRVVQSTMSQFCDSQGGATTKIDSRDNATTQACMSARTILDSTMKDVSSVDSSKMQAVMQELDRVWQMDPGSKVIIFSQFLGFLDLMENRLSRVGIPFFRLDGRLSLKGRMHVLEHFRSCDDDDKVNNKKKQPQRAAATRSRKDASLVDTAAAKTDEGDYPHGNNIERGTVLLMSMSAGGEGLNLVAASSVFLVDPWWNSAREDQCVNRIHRIGQKASVVRVRKFVTVNTVEESIVQLQSRKKYMADQVYNDNGTAGNHDDDDDGGGTARLNLDDFKLIFRKE